MTYITKNNNKEIFSFQFLWMVESLFIQRKCVLPLITILAADKLIFIFFVGFRKKNLAWMIWLETSFKVKICYKSVERKYFSEIPGFIYSCSISHIWEHELCLGQLGSLDSKGKFLKFCSSMLLLRASFSCFNDKTKTN